MSKIYLVAYHFKALIIPKLNQYFVFKKFENRSDGGHLIAQNMKHVLGRHFEQGHGILVLMVPMSLDFYTLSNDGSHDGVSKKILRVNPPKPYFGVGGKIQKYAKKYFSCPLLHIPKRV